MAQCVAVIHSDTLEVVTVFGKEQESDVYLQHLSPEDRAKCVIMDIPQELQAWAVRPTRNTDGSIKLDFDADKHKFFRLNFIRQQRNELLKESDWTQFPNTKLSDDKKADWETYRQALREIPDTLTDPDNVVWPTPPS